MAIYFNTLKAKQSKFGIKISGKVEDIIAELQANQKNGYINLELKDRKELGKYGETHLFTVDTFEPKPKVV